MKILHLSHTHITVIIGFVIAHSRLKLHGRYVGYDFACGVERVIPLFHHKMFKYDLIML